MCSGAKYRRSLRNTWQSRPGFEIPPTTSSRRRRAVSEIAINGDAFDLWGGGVVNRRTCRASYRYRFVRYVFKPNLAGESVVPRGKFDSFFFSRMQPVFPRSRSNLHSNASIRSDSLTIFDGFRAKPVYQLASGRNCESPTIAT